MQKRAASMISAPRVLCLALAFAIAILCACGSDGPSSNNPGSEPSSSSYVKQLSSVVKNDAVILSFNFSPLVISETNLHAEVTYLAEDENPEVVSNNGLDSVVLLLEGTTIAKDQNKISGKLEKDYLFEDKYCDGESHQVCAYAYFKGAIVDGLCHDFTRNVASCRPSSSATPLPSSSSQVPPKQFVYVNEFELNSNKSPRGIKLSTGEPANTVDAADVWLPNNGEFEVRAGASIAVLGKTSEDVPSPTNTSDFVLPSRNADWGSTADYTIFGNYGEYCVIRLNNAAIEWNSNSYLIVPIVMVDGGKGRVKVWKVN